MEGRMILERSDVGRPLYNLGSSLMPALTASLLILALRRKNFFAKFFNFEFILVGVVVVLQYITSNRLPLAYTLLVFFALFSLERKIPRFVLMLVFVGFLGLYLGMSGFSSIIRQNREALEDQNVIQASFTEAFLGDNLSDLRDGAWVLGQWDYKPLNGTTYLGGLASMIPSAIFPQKKDWYLGLVAIKIVNWPTEEHFGLRVSFFEESFLNFGLAGVVGLAVILGTCFSYLLRRSFICRQLPHPC